MRLIIRTALWYFLLAAFVFGIGSSIIYVLIKNAVQVETDYELRGDLNGIRNALKNGVTPAQIQTPRIKITLLDTIQYCKIDSTFSDTLIFLKRTNNLESFRKLVATIDAQKKFYRIEIVNIIFEQEDISEVVYQIITRLFIFMSVVLLLASFLLSRQLLQPFKKLLDSIEQFSLKADKPLNLPSTTIYEFKQLNAFLTRMTSKARRDYQSLKEFTENASHEMQTPLAIAKGKLELLQQNINLDENQSKLLDDSQKALTKLSRLGQALSLLAKIENQEFTTQTNIDFSTIVTHTISLFEELATLKNIKLEYYLQPNIYVKMDTTLADVLVTNIIKNAIQHNIENGWIRVYLDQHKLEVINSGEELHLSPETLFLRFKKSNQSKGSLGLGLAIVKKICEVNQLQVQYNYNDQTHSVQILLR